LTNAFWRYIFAVKQFIEIMKTEKFIKILFFSYLYMAILAEGISQDWLFRVHSVENLSGMPTMSCFSDSYAGFHFRNDFGMKEMMFADCSGTWHIKKNMLMFSINHYGYGNYGEMTLSVGYGRNFGDRFAMTARIFYMMAHARSYPTRHSLCTDFALTYKVSGKLLLNATVYNPFMMRYGIVGQEIIPLKFAVGCTYLPVQKLLLSLTTTKMLPGEWEVDCRFMAQPIPPLLLAVHGSNSRLGIFIGLIYRKFLISVEAAWYYRVSVSSQIGGEFYWEEEMRIRR
jgi:hypothetical protein